MKAVSKAKKLAEKVSEFDDISLASLGVHLFFGTVDETSVKSAAEFLLKSHFLFKEPRELSLFLNSIGGSCYDGFALTDIMEVSRHPVKTIAMGNVLSMGVLVLCAGAKGRRLMTKNTQVMVHQFHHTIEGKFHEMEATFKAQVYLKKQFLTHFKRHTTMTDKQIETIMFGPTDYWLSPKECLDYGIIDQIIDELPDAILSHRESLPLSS
jgi:ATP-dependent Clp endopeptidase proteolytic subunit ClpP